MSVHSRELTKRIAKMQRSGMTKEEYVTDMSVLFFEFQNNLKLFHFQTGNYGAHKSSDKLHGKMAELSDEFLETFQGKYGRIPAIVKERSVAIISSDEEDDIYALCDNFIQEIDEKSALALDVTKDSELFSLLDGIKVQIQRFKYLIGFT